MSTKKKRAKSAKREHCFYCIEILDWEMPYSLSVNHNTKITDDLYLENANLSLKGRLVHPEKLSDKTIEMTIYGNRQLVDALRKPYDHQHQPKAVGELKVRGEQRNFIGWLPFDALSPIASMLQAGKINIVELSGHSLYRGTTDIAGIHFQREWDPEDYI